MQTNKKTFGKATRPPDAPAPAPAPKLQKPKPVISSEQRTKARKRTLLKGRLVYGHDGAFTVDCTISDLSETGARVSVESSVPLPEEVMLVHLRETLAFEAKVQWRRPDGMGGLAFTKVHDLEKADTPLLKLLRYYCIEHNLR